MRSTLLALARSSPSGDEERETVKRMRIPPSSLETRSAHGVVHQRRIIVNETCSISRDHDDAMTLIVAYSVSRE